MTSVRETAGRRRPLLIAVDGYDGSGKSTLVAALAASLRRDGWSVTKVGRRGLTTSPIIEALTEIIMLSDGEPGIVGEDANALLRLARIYERVDLAEAAATDVVLLDRWIPSDLGQLEAPTRERYRRDYESLVARSAADLTVYLDGPFDTMWERVNARGQVLSAKERLGRDHNKTRFDQLAAALESYRASGGVYERIDCTLPVDEVVQASRTMIDPLLPARSPVH